MRTGFIFTVGLLLSLLATSCGKKEVKILSPNVEGDLKGCFKVLDEVCEVVKDDDGNSTITVNIERTDQSVPFTPKTVGVFGDEDNDPLVLAGFGFEGYNDKEETMDVVDAEDNHYMSKEQLEILKLAPGEKGTLTIKFGEDLPEGIIITSELDFISTGEIAFNGAIGKYGIKNCTMDFNFQNKKIIGQYQYLTSPAGAYLYLMGNVVTVDKEPGDYTFKIVIAEDNGRGDLTGKFKGQLKLIRDSKTSPYYYVLLGTFRNFRLDDYRYDLKSEPLNEIQFTDILKNSYASTMNPSFANADFDSFGFRSYAEEANYSGKSEAGDASIDELIRSYRNFYKKYIKVLKRVKHNDPMAIMEYTELLQEYHDYTQKLQKVKGNMSPSQLQEFMKMNEEIAREASQI